MPKLKKEATQVRRALSRKGYTLVQARRGGHWKVYDHNGKLLGTLANSPDCYRTIQNCLSDIKNNGGDVSGIYGRR